MSRENAQISLLVLLLVLQKSSLPCYHEIRCCMVAVADLYKSPSDIIFISLATILWDIGK